MQDSAVNHRAVTLKRCAANIMKVYFKKEKKPICIEIFIHGLKYINIFLILYTKCDRKFLYILQCVANQKGLRTAVTERQHRPGITRQNYIV
jgi:hypothetical protein